MDKEVAKALKDLMETIQKIVDQLKTQHELNQAIVDKIKAMENYDYLES
tara:strand:- start:141 stop:287 length:147 start_codon:yes stop_codon:yes gene_type:complete